MQGLKDRVAIITGGSSGLGRAAARRLGSEGCQIGILDIRDADPVCQEIQAAGGRAASWMGDTTNEQQLTDIFRDIGARFERIDVLVNNAGILAPRIPWYEWDPREVERFVRINYMGYYLTTRAAYPLLKKSPAARIINVASRTFFMGNPGQFPYVASKGAVQGFTWSLARELGDEGITVNAVMPGMVATEGTRANSNEAAFTRVMQNQAIKKRVEPEHLAGLIAFVASDDAAMITGQTIICDGGGYLH